MRSLDVGIIGAGTAGSAAAIFLARAGHQVTVYERVPSPGPVGAGITLQPTGLHVLARLGLHGEVVARGARIQRLHCMRRGRRTLVDLSYVGSHLPAHLSGHELFGLGVHRGVLFESLWRAMARQPVKVRTGVEIVDLARAEPRGRGQQHARESWFVDVERARHGPHELVVVADGARSQLRDDTGTSKRITQYPWGALWFVGKEWRDADAPERALLHQVVDGNQSFLGLLPTGRGPSGMSTASASASVGRDPGREPLVSLFWSLRCDRLAAWKARGLDAWKDDARALAPECGPILDQIERPEQVLFAAYHDVVMDRWSTRNVVYLGDAAHATSPQLGQGANLALWDAMTLADVLAEEERDLATALDRYSRVRADHLAFYQFMTRALTPFFQGDHAILGALRDIGMPIMSRLPLFDRVMTLTMLGVVDGFGGGLLPISLEAGRSGSCSDA
ncbi:MAG: FAD-dependent monooxygenase [Deltaproteobacteria bacterium]|nr:FAD-dependent monooxygenase [Deltaproteobacteria bacterium]